jgi:hypothetical protein
MNVVTKKGFNSSMYFFQRSQVNNQELFLLSGVVYRYRGIWDFAYMIF